MLIADLVGNLGNQLFCYASTKSIAMDLGFEYRYRVVKPNSAKLPSGLDIYSHEYRYDFETAFNIDISERIDQIPTIVQNKWTWETNSTTNFIEDVYNINDDTHLCGYFQSPKYFNHRRSQVLDWFRFQDKFLNWGELKRQKIIESTGVNHLVSIHMRYGKDYRYLREALDPTYYGRAIQRIKKDFPNDNLCFILFSDVPKVTKSLLTYKDVIIHEGTMFEDLNLMTLCDSHIVGNSTFSWWGAWLARESKGEVICPSIWPLADDNCLPLDIFPSSWIVVEGMRERVTYKTYIREIFIKHFPAIGKYIIHLVKAMKRRIKNVSIIKVIDAQYSKSIK